MIFRRALLKEFAELAAAVLMVLVGIAVTTFLIRFLGQAATGRVAAEAVLALVGFRTVAALPVLLTLTLFITVLLALTRSYRDNEMMVWFSSGIGITGWVSPVMLFATPLVLLVALLTLFLSPWAYARGEEYVQQMRNREDSALVTAGVFRESSQADRVFFVEEFAPLAGTVTNVFVSFVQHRRQGTMVARTGHQETAENGDRFLVLEHGRRYEGRPGRADFRIVEFDRYAVRVEAHEEGSGGSVGTSAISTAELVRSPRLEHKAELAWRLSFPVAGAMLALLAVPLSFVNPRAGRSLNLVLAILVFFIYSNMLSVTRAWVAQGKVDALLASVGLHGAMLLVFAFLMWRRVSVRRISWWRR